MVKEEILEKKVALITGITGQDGSYLANFLLEKGYEIYGMHRRTSGDSLERIGGLRKKINLIEGDVTDMSSIVNIIQNTKPTEIYNLAAQSFVKDSWSQPAFTLNTNAGGVLNFLEAIKTINPKIKFYQASTSEMFGSSPPPQNEETKFHPRSPYGAAKAFGHYITQNYRESDDKIFGCSGILFNHESPRRGKQFITRKVSHSVAKIKLGFQDYFEVGNIDAKRDWGFAGDYVEAMWLMLQQEKPGDYVVGTGEAHSVREFIEEAFKVADMPQITWEGKGVDEVGNIDGKTVVQINPKYYRPAEVDYLLADATKARTELGWKPKVYFKELVEMMVKSDIDHLKKYGLLENDMSRLDI